MVRESWATPTCFRPKRVPSIHHPFEFLGQGAEGARLPLGGGWLGAECWRLSGVSVGGERYWMGDEAVSRWSPWHERFLRVDVGGGDDLLVLGQPQEEGAGLVGVAPYSSMPTCAAESRDDFRLSCVCLTAKACHPHVMMPMTLGLSPVTSS